MYTLCPRKNDNFSSTKNMTVITGCEKNGAGLSPCLSSYIFIMEK